MSTVDVLNANGVRFTGNDLIVACREVGVPLWIGAAFAEHESGGSNVFGHDSGGAYSGAGVVTQAKFDDFVKMIASGHRSNGVGPMQITYPGYFPEAAKEGLNLANSHDNYVFGLRIIKAYLQGDFSDASLNRAGQRYNSGSATGAPSYGSLTVSLCHKWRKLLGDTPTPTPMPTLQQGSTGATVKSLQSFLMRVFPAYAGPIKTHGGADGVYGSGTAYVVREFQRRSHLVADGVVGPLTWSALKSNGYSA